MECLKGKASIAMILILTLAIVATGSVSSTCSYDTLVALLNPKKVSEHCLSTWILNDKGNKPIAFYAFMRSSFTPGGKGNVLVFETVKTDVLNAYDNITGVYTVPKSGMYVFNWSIREAKSEHSVELMVNAEVVGATFKRAEGRDDGMVSGTVVVDVDKGDRVYLRTHSAYDLGQRIHNNLHGRSSFSGWRL